MANLAHPGDLTRLRLFNLNSVTAGVAAGCLMSLGAPLSFAAARGAMLTGGLTPGDLIVVRYLVAGPLMLPVLIYFGVSRLAGLGWRRGIILAILGGPSFTLLQTAGLAYAPLAHGGVITPAAVAIISTILAALMLHERLGSVRLAGSALLIVGIVLIGWDGLSGVTGSKVWLGDLLFLAAAAAWGLFSVLVRRWRVNALQAITVVSVLSAAVTVPGYLAVFGTAHIVELPRGTLLAQGLLQGCLHGVLATLGFTHAIRVLGVSRAVFFAAVVPVVSVLIGIPLLHEIPSPQQWLGVGVATTGLLAAILLPGLLRRMLDQHHSLDLTAPCAHARGAVDKTILWCCWRTSYPIRRSTSCGEPPRDRWGLRVRPLGRWWPAPRSPPFRPR